MATSGRPKLDPTANAHSPRVAVRVPQRVRQRLGRRAEEEGRSISEAVRAAIESWASEPAAAERAQLRHIVHLTDRDREALFLTSNANVRRLLEQHGR